MPLCYNCRRDAAVDIEVEPVDLDEPCSRCGWYSDVYHFVDDEAPVDQSEVVREFGNRGLSELRLLMRHGWISYTIDWLLQTEDRRGGDNE